MRTSLLDCTLRDGGHVVNCNFGIEVLNGIIHSLVDSGTDIIELGFLRDTEYVLGKTEYSDIYQAEKLIENVNGRSKFALLIQQDQYDVEKLPECNSQIQIIRVSFHDYDIEKGLDFCKKVQEKGYNCYCNPINIMGYTDEEIISIIKSVNKYNLSGFTIVDTFGSMNLRELSRIYYLVENNLSTDICIGLHLHENLSLSFALAQHFLEIRYETRDICIDGSLLGMGRAPGNLCLELIVNHMNKYYKQTYKVDPLMDAIDDYIMPFRKRYEWGYTTPYSLSAQYHVHRSYAEYLQNKSKLRTKEIREILSAIKPEYRTKYSAMHIEMLYQDYMNVHLNDNNYIEQLKVLIENKTVLLLGSGKNIVNERSIIQNFLDKNPGTIIISANFNGGIFQPNYIFFNNYRRFINTKTPKKVPIIISSNLLRNGCTAQFIIEYSKLRCNNILRGDNSLPMLLNLLKMINIKKCWLAGFDGYTGMFNDYCDKNMDNIVLWDDINENMSELLEMFFSDMELNYLTKSLYNSRR